MTGGWFAIIDCAGDPRLHQLVQSCREKACLFMGDIHPDLQAASPWLVRIDETEPLLSTWQTHGKGAFWGIMCQSSLDVEGLRRHFRRFLQARLPDGMMVLFRFFDPRIFPTYLRAASPEERAPWFDGVIQYAMEGDGGVTHQFTMAGDVLMDGTQAVG